MAKTLMENTLDIVTLALAKGFDEDLFPAFEGEGAELDFFSEDEAPGTVNPRKYWLGGEIDTLPELRHATDVQRSITQGGNVALADAVASAKPGDAYHDVKNWMGRFDNGEIPLKSMMAVHGVHYSGKGTHYFRPDAGQMFKQMVAAAKRDKVNITLTDSYRSLAGQHAAKADKGKLAATPGTSNHGWGMAIDAATGREWIRDNGHRYGWIRPSWASDSYEPWHFEFIGSDKAKLDAFKKPKKQKPPQKFTRRYRAQPPSDAYEGTAPEFNPMVAIPNAMVEVFAGDSLGAEVRKPKGRKGGGGKGLPEGVKAQLRAGFKSIGRNDLAKMVNTEAFEIWVDQESGWRRGAVSPANNQGYANAGYFQMWLHPSRTWLTKFMKGGKFTASPYQQARMVATHFTLTPERIRSFANQIKAGSYVGWG